MFNHRRWPALLLSAALTASSVTVLAMAGEELSRPPKESTPSLIETLQSVELTLGIEEADIEPTIPPEDPNLIKIMLNGERLPLEVNPIIIDGNTFVPLRAFSEAMGCTVQWSANGLVTVLRGSELKLEVQTGSDLICANDRYFYMPAKAVSIDGNLMVPIRGLAKVFTFTVEWLQASNSIFLHGGQPLATADSFYSSDDLLWLSRIIYAESRGEPLEGKIAVGNVVINRTNASQFPDTIFDVIFDKKNGTQFTPTKNGSIYNTPSEECVLAAKLCLEGHTVAEKALYFLSSTGKSGWIVRTRTFVTKIGNHSFFS